MTHNGPGMGTPTVRDGRYCGRDEGFTLDLRVDLRGSRAVSGDVFRGATVGDDFVGSFATEAWSGAAPPPMPLTATWHGADGDQTKADVGLLATVGTPDDLVLELSMGGDPDSLEAGTMLRFEVKRDGEPLREVRLAIDVENSALADAREDLRKKVREAFATTGISVTDAGEERIVDHTAGELWSESDIFDKLQDALGHEDREMDRPGWTARLLMLSRSKRDDLLGVMFDTDALPRQAAAVFVDSISATSGPDAGRADTKLVQTTVHELGHALNLVHRFARGVRRSSSHSFMNYDWRFRGGDHSDDYWKGFNHTFDDDELRFLRHAPWSQITPGGAAFGSASYWAGVRDAPPTKPWSDLRLWLTPPQGLPATGFAHGQPIYLEVSLRNTGCTSVKVPRHALDIKAGQLDVFIEHVAGADGAPVDERLAVSRPFAAAMQRCFDVGTVKQVELGFGDAIHSNMNLTYGSDRLSFPEAGQYEVTPVLTFSAPDGADLDHQVVGRPLRITVARPGGNEGEIERVLRTPEASLAVALGGAASLVDATAAMRELVDRPVDSLHQSVVADPIIATVSRVLGIEAGRKGTKNESGPDLEQAAERLEQACDLGAAAFDPHTAEHTRRLAAQYRARANRSVRPGDTVPNVVVDLWTRPRDGSAAQGGRRSGFLVAGEAQPHQRGPQQAGGVLTRADQLPAEVMEGGVVVEADVVVTAEDGLTEHLTASRIDVVGPAKGQRPVLAHLLLSRPVPVAPLLPEAGRADLSPQDREPFFGDTGTPTGAVAALVDRALDAWREAVDQAEAGAPEQAPDPHSVRGFAYTGISTDDPFGWRCWFTSKCAYEPKRGDEPYGRGERSVSVRVERGQEPCDGKMSS